MPGSTAPSAGGAEISAIGPLTSAGREAAVAAVGSPAWSASPECTEMIGVPTSTATPSGTSSLSTTPSYGLGSFDLHDDLVDADLVAWLHVPLDDLRFGQALADVGELELPQFRHDVPSVAERALDGIEYPVQVGQVMLLDP